MKQLISLAILGLVLTGCGEQLQATYEGTAFLSKDNCGNSDLQEVAMTVSMRKSGSGAEFLITEFKSLNSSNSLSVDTTNYIRGRAMKAELRGNNSIATSNPIYPLSESAQTKILASLDDRGIDDLTEEEMALIESDSISVFGSLRSDRKLIETFEVDIVSQKKVGNSLEQCKIEFTATENGLAQIDG